MSSSFSFTRSIFSLLIRARSWTRSISFASSCFTQLNHLLLNCSGRNYCISYKLQDSTPLYTEGLRGVTSYDITLNLVSSSIWTSPTKQMPYPEAGIIQPQSNILYYLRLPCPLAILTILEVVALALRLPDDALA